MDNLQTAFIDYIVDNIDDYKNLNALIELALSQSGYSDIEDALADTFEDASAEKVGKVDCTLTVDSDGALVAFKLETEEIEASIKVIKKDGIKPDEDELSDFLDEAEDEYNSHDPGYYDDVVTTAQSDLEHLLEDVQVAADAWFTENYADLYYSGDDESGYFGCYAGGTYLNVYFELGTALTEDKAHEIETNFIEFLENEGYLEELIANGGGVDVYFWDTNDEICYEKYYQ